MWLSSLSFLFFYMHLILWQSLDNSDFPLCFFNLDLSSKLQTYVPTTYLSHSLRDLQSILSQAECVVLPNLLQLQLISISSSTILSHSCSTQMKLFAILFFLPIPIFNLSAIFLILPSIYIQDQTCLIIPGAIIIMFL